MQKIKLLDQLEILKIAAGQVIDRPANVVKELVENSIDAGATQITVYIENGGKDLIRVIDNGCGMSSQDAIFCFKKHATSKIKKIGDLDSIQTFGFRGEALARISAVSKVTLITKDKKSQNGTKLVLENGDITSESEVPFEQGTDLSIKSLFYNTPARQKFLKKRETENRHIIQLFQSFCLDYLAVSFKLFVDKKLAINCAATNDIIKRAAQIWDHNFAKNLLKIETAKQNDKPYIYGAITNHQYFRYDRNNIFLFVNKRWVKNYEIQSALLKGYANVLPPARYPAAFIFVDIDPGLVDVNIHPRKEEVKFLHPRMLTKILQTTVKKALEDHLSNQIKRDVVFKQEPVSPAFNSQKLNALPNTPLNSQNNSQNIDTTLSSSQNNNFTPFNFDNFLAHSTQKKSSNIVIPSINPQAQHKQSEKLTQADICEQKSQTQTILPEYEIIGQFKKSYILIEKTDGLFFVDQHAAHERVLYEIFSKRFENVATVKLLFPQLIKLKQEDIALLEPNLDIFKKNGIDTEIFGDTQLKIQATPVHLKNIDLEELVQEVVSWIKEFQELDSQDFFKKINENMHAQMACKAAVKSGDTLTREQMAKLLHDLETTENRFACPHGRPTGWILTTHEIEKKFKRKL